MKHHVKFLGLAVLLVLAISATPAQASTIATISGCYDCRIGDSPSLIFHNTSLFAFTDVNLKLTGYQGLNNGISQSIGLPDIGAGTDYAYDWLGALVPGNLFSYDYDDEYGGDPIHSFQLNHACDGQNGYGGYYCAQTGNFYVTFTAKWNGMDIFSQFSPDPTLPGACNAAGAFVGWEGLDPNGWAESIYDAHAGSIDGVLANIQEGTPPPVGVPEPASLTLLAGGLVGLVGLSRKFRS